VTLRIATIEGLGEVDEAAWDALSGEDHPFVEHAFLRSLEDERCVGADAGWQPAHVLVRDGDALVGAAPVYVKDHSQGEYVFDWGWADASERAGIPYYPKLVVAVPFTPATGPRLLVHPSADAPEVRAALVQGIRAVADAVGASSVHALFVPEVEAEALAGLGLRRRLSYQFHWEDHGYGDFEGWLATLTSKRRKELRRERRQAESLGLDLAVERVVDWPERDLHALFRCYATTIAQHGWSAAYLTESWFLALPERLGHRALVATARRHGALVAGSLAFQRGRHLYGRYWGALEPVPALHFELCYHRLIAWALEHGLTRFEAGAQGRHKLARGLMPAFTHSAHWIRHPGLDRAVGDFLKTEARRVAAEVAALAAHGPYREEEQG
jgi:predicted N-acyltransferase